MNSGQVREEDVEQDRVAHRRDGEDWDRQLAGPPNLNQSPKFEPEPRSRIGVTGPSPTRGGPFDGSRQRPKDSTCGCIRTRPGSWTCVAERKGSTSWGFTTGW